MVPVSQADGNSTHPGAEAGGYLGSIDALHRLEQLVGIIRESAGIFLKYTQ